MGLWYADPEWADATTFEMMNGEQVKKGDAIFPRMDIGKELEELEKLNVKGADAQATGTEANAAPAPLELKEEIVYDDFAKLDLRVGTIVSAMKHPKGEKLLVFQVKIGSETRQILSGVAEYYKPEDTIGQKVVVVANLAPRMLRGMESNGMLLFADNTVDGKETFEFVTTVADDGNAVT